MVINLMTIDDVDAVAQIERETFAKPWTREDFEREMTENKCARYMVARVNGEVAAYAGTWLVMDEGHITNVAVRSDMRARGIGEAVVRAMIQMAADSGVRYMTLEVRRSNVAAISLYEKLGFIRVGTRKRYYEDNREDALIMALVDMPEGDPER
ncbi:MAG: ribosomal protein S18-alanine N-acetyltransferase, partial [Clostridia bacterium]|nr:ribosomal protein S18-alanine N-acetyltransferase [Clostridia bacterium]